MEDRKTIFEMGDDKEWEDGDDSKLETSAIFEGYEMGYKAGVREAVAYLAEVFEGTYDTDVFERLEVEAPEEADR